MDVNAARIRPLKYDKVMSVSMSSQPSDKCSKSEGALLDYGCFFGACGFCELSCVGDVRLTLLIFFFFSGNL